MIRVKIIAVGKVKESYIKEGIEEYAKRLSRFCNFSIEEVGEENFRNADEAERTIIKEREADRILVKLSGTVFVMAIEGKKMSSEKFSETISQIKNRGVSEITFVIGGSYGLSDRVKNKADYSFSFSDMTFPHTLFRLMLTEQIYRAFTIEEGSPYHK